MSRPAEPSLPFSPMPVSPAPGRLETLTVPLVLFPLAGAFFALERRSVVALTARCPDGSPALEALLALTLPAGELPGYGLCLRNSRGEHWVRVNGPVEHQDVAATALFAPPPLVLAGCRLPALKALLCLPGQVIPVLDAEALV